MTDWDKLRELGRQAEELRSVGTLTYETWRELFNDARDACRGDFDQSDLLLPYARQEWVRRYVAEEQQAVA